MSSIVFSQKNSKNKFYGCITQECKIVQSFLNAENLLQIDEIQKSQDWLNVTKELVNPKTIDTTSCFIHQLQSELFYYTGLFQFGKLEAKKGVEKAIKIKDSLLISENYFFLGINHFELNEYNDALKALLVSKKYFPKKTIKHIKDCIQEEHIYNNIAQVYLKLHQFEQAKANNKMAYDYAIKAGSKRGIPNSEQTFGEIFLLKKQHDSASFYFKKSIVSAKKSLYYDIVLMNYSFLMKSNFDDIEQIEYWYKSGLDLITKHTINDTYKRYFYSYALDVFKQKKNANQIISLQEKIINLDSKKQEVGNFYIQNFTNKYIKSEKKLLSLEINELKRQRNISFLQLIAAILCMIALSLITIIFRRKNKVARRLLEQKNQISKDLHDDIGSGLSSILIHADLLSKSTETTPKQKIFLSKINETGKDISQKLNTFIWSLNIENNNLQDFVEYAKKYSLTLFDGNSIEFVFLDKIPSEFKNASIDGNIRKNLFLCLKEILNNSLKHSEATSIKCSISILEKSKLELVIQDNGVGLKTDNLFGNGIKNIKKRIDDSKGSIIIKEENGLKTTILIPL